jgi:hypothetical protein
VAQLLLQPLLQPFSQPGAFDTRDSVPQSATVNLSVLGDVLVTGIGGRPLYAAPLPNPAPFLRRFKDEEYIYVDPSSLDLDDEADDGCEEDDDSDVGGWGGGVMLDEHEHGLADDYSRAIRILRTRRALDSTLPGQNDGDTASLAAKGELDFLPHNSEYWEVSDGYEVTNLSHRD